MVCVPGGASRINSFALVSYLSGPLAGFLDGLREELAPGCFPQAHVTLLPPRPLAAKTEPAWMELRESAAAFRPIDMELAGVELFPVSDVVYLAIGAGAKELEGLHAALNRGELKYEEPFVYRPHVTLAQEFPVEHVDRIREIAKRRWAAFPGRRGFRVETLTLVQCLSDKTWIDLGECRLGEPHAGVLEPLVAGQCRSNGSTEVRAAGVRRSGNVFADLGFENAEERRTKVLLAGAIGELLHRQRLKQAPVARRLGVIQPKVSALLNYKLEGFSVERLMHFLATLDQDIEIVIRGKPRSRRAARIVVTAA